MIYLSVCLYVYLFWLDAKIYLFNVFIIKDVFCFFYCRCFLKYGLDCTKLCVLCVINWNTVEWKNLHLFGFPVWNLNSKRFTIYKDCLMCFPLNFSFWEDKQSVKRKKTVMKVIIVLCKRVFVKSESEQYLCFW